MNRMHDVALATVTRILSRAGVSVGGPNPWDIAVHDDRFYCKVLTQGSVGIGESYVDGWWDCPRLDDLAARVLAVRADERVLDWRRLLLGAAERLFNMQSVRRAGRVAEVHYDLDEQLFEAMLGPTMSYSCAYFDGTDDLDAAQVAKMDLICRKLAIVPGERLLDIGSGWGSLLRHAADHHGCEGVGITLSRPQRDHAAALGDGRPVRYLVADYRSAAMERLGRFDKIVSVGMFEHVGPKNHRTFMRAVHRLLRDRGLFLLHTIGNESAGMEPWLHRNIFPNSSLPSIACIADAARGLFVMEDWHNLRAHYDRTLLAWHARFERHAEEEGLPRRFRRKWRFYLLCSAGSFRAGVRNQLWQIVFSKRGVPGGYRSVR